MALRHCDGYDPNLTRTLPAGQFTPSAMALSPWNQAAPDGHVIVCCACTLIFDDVDRRTDWPHEIIRPGVIIAPPRPPAALNMAPVPTARDRPHP
jgi:hypothetical protein